MVGQGSPRTSLRFIPGLCARAVFAGPYVLVVLRALMFALCLGICGSASADNSLRMRIAWGGSQERTWTGSISLSKGMLSSPCPLGIEADEPGSMWLEGGRLFVRQKTARLYDGLDIDVAAGSDDAVLRIELFSATGAAREVKIEIPTRDLANMVGERAYNANLDDRGTRLLVRRVPGDMLRLKFERKSLVFSPGEQFKLSVLPHHIPGLDAQSARIKVDVYPARGDRPISERD